MITPYEAARRIEDLMFDAYDLLGLSRTRELALRGGREASMVGLDDEVLARSPSIAASVEEVREAAYRAMKG